MKFPQAEVADLPEIDIKIHRYGKTLFEIDTINFQQELKSIREEYSIFLNADLNDTSNIQQLYTYVTDTQLISIFEKSVEVYPNTYQLENELSDAFARHHYFFPNNTIPKVYTYISDLYYELPIWIKNDILVIAIDLYLGDNFPLYFRLGLPQYKIRCMRPENLPVDVMKAMYFNEVDLLSAVADYQGRERRFGDVGKGDVPPSDSGKRKSIFDRSRWKSLLKVR